MSAVGWRILNSFATFFCAWHMFSCSLLASLVRDVVLLNVLFLLSNLYVRAPFQKKTLPQLQGHLTYGSLRFQLNFIRVYLATLRGENSPCLAATAELTKEQEEEAVLKEVQSFTLASHFFWGLWSLVNSKVSQIPFGYLVSIYNFRYSMELIFVVFLGIQQCQVQRLLPAQE